MKLGRKTASIRDAVAVAVLVSGAYLYGDHILTRFDSHEAAVTAAFAAAQALEAAQRNEEKASDGAWMVTDQENIQAQRDTNTKIEDVKSQLASVRAALSEIHNEVHQNYDLFGGLERSMETLTFALGKHEGHHDAIPARAEQ